MTPLEEKLEHFIAQIPQNEIIMSPQPFIKADKDYIPNLLATFINESRATFKLIQDHLSTEQRILEVGAGLCFCSLFLKQEGYDIVALEPASNGYENFEVVKKSILSHYRHLKLEVLDSKIENLKENDKKYDLIFSNNVLEHIPDIENAFKAMTSLLSSDGIMIHSCPNYFIPYEPHLGIPALKPFKNLSEIIFKKKTSKLKDVWDSLNFISYFDVIRFSKKNNLHVSFQKSLLYYAFCRIEHDILYRERHSSSLLVLFYFFLKRTKLLYLLKFLPPFLSTPMIFRLKKSVTLFE